MERTQLIAANWKMHKTAQETTTFAEELVPLVKNSKREIVICAPYTVLHDLLKALKSTNMAFGAQNMHHEERGAFTGEISSIMLKDAGCEYVILGHSERRQYFNESNEFINKKMHSALQHGLKAILCIGETVQEREAKKTFDVLKKQMGECLSSVAKESMKSVVIAYEPVWAISGGNPNVKAATIDDAEAAHEFIRSMLSDLFGKKIAQETRILYGGSMKPENASSLLRQKNIDGGLVGGASLDPKQFADICNS